MHVMSKMLIFFSPSGAGTGKRVRSPSPPRKKVSPPRWVLFVCSFLIFMISWHFLLVYNCLQALFHYFPPHFSPYQESITSSWVYGSSHWPSIKECAWRTFKRNILWVLLPCRKHMDCFVILFGRSRWSRLSVAVHLAALLSVECNAC